MNLEELTCPICTDYFTIPTYQCRNLHSICVKCYEKVTFCPFCRIAYDGPLLHNTKIEELLDVPVLPCKNSALGCEAKLKCEPMKNHELNCPYESVKCPTYRTSCSAIVQIKDLGTHLAENHNCTFVKHCEELFVLNIGNIFEKCQTYEYFLDLENGPKFFISFILCCLNRKTKNFRMHPLHIHSGHITGKSEHTVDVVLRESNPKKYHRFEQPFLRYENQIEHDFSKRCRFLFNATRKNDNDQKSVLIFFNVKPAANF